LIGTALEFVLPVLHGEIRTPRVASARTKDASERRARTADAARDELLRLVPADGVLSGLALVRAGDCAIVCARLEQLHRIGETQAQRFNPPDPATAIDSGLDAAITAAGANDDTRADLVALLNTALVDTADLYTAKPLYINPGFRLSAAVRGADADIIADGVLVDFKATKQRTVISAAEIYQLVGYVLLDHDDRYSIKSAGVHALRWRRRWTIPVAQLLAWLAGDERPLAEWRQRFAAALGERAQRILARPGRS
jgi:hypothetical protein